MSPVTHRNIIRHELIGLEGKVVQSLHLGYLGIGGRIIDETQKTLLILKGNQRKRIPKKAVVLEITLRDGSTVEVEGKNILSRPVDRVKKRFGRRKAKSRRKSKYISDER